MVMTRFEGNVLKQQQKWFLPGIQSSERANSSQGMGLPTPGKKQYSLCFLEIFHLTTWNLSEPGVKSLGLVTSPLLRR